MKTYNFDICKIISLLTCNPAKIVGLKSGEIKKGANADVIVFDSEKPWKINPEIFYSKSKNTPFDGMLVEGKNLMTFIDGRLVFDIK